MPGGARRARAAARQARAAVIWTDHTARDDAAPVRGADAVRLAYALSVDCWRLAGRALPSYPRAEIPVTFVRR